MVKLFLWFYCLPIEGVLLLILLATVAFFILRHLLGNTMYWKAGIPILLLCWVAVILFATLGQRTEGVNFSGPVLTPFISYYAVLKGETKELLRSNFMNIVLFYPAGLLVCEILPKHRKRLWKVVLITTVFALVSFGVEYAQYRFGLGQAEIDDVIHNTVGALIGSLVCGVSKKFHK